MCVDQSGVSSSADQLELNEGPQMTATEVQVRYELMQRLLGPTLGRLQSEFLNPIVERAFYSMLRGNALPPMPEVLQQIGGDLDIEYVGPLARSQKMDEVTSYPTRNRRDYATGSS